ncbi:uncharacterized protein LOC123010379 [Tribolium madens]|uniref:uncharacterized protein LOC123010379 n=1 Tax=Tribolium madens TaxID=41895 RepID=UPI001CF75978|nr:uncharacterized protein LOC123010379 [Tribolium madens]
MPDAIMKPIYLRGLLWLYLLGCFLFAAALEPGFLDFDNLPDTNFSCVGKVIGGYYADLETNCQMFHVCTIGQLDEPMDIRFLCLNGTVFDQETRVCERIDEVDCSKSEQFYSLNLELYGNTQPSVLEESETDPPIIIKASTTTTTTTPRPKPKTTRTYFTTPVPTVTTKVISSHHFPISGQTDIRFNPEEINISLNPGAPPNIRKPVSYHQQVFSDNKKVVVTTHTTYGSDKDDILRVVPNTQRPVSSTQKTKPPATPADINYGFTYHQTEKVPHNYQYHHASFQHGQFRDQFKTTERATTRKHVYKEPTTFRTTYVKPQYQYHTEKPQRVQLPVPLLPTLPPLTFSSPAPFSLGHHIETKRYTNEHQPPRIIISASASVSDASGRRLNYSLGTIGVTPLLEQSPKTYDEYKDHDVVLDPFYHDVPKIKTKRRKRQVNHSEVIKNEQEAVDVLKFLFDWYQNHQRTSTIRVPIDAEDITEINQELAPLVAPTKTEENFEQSALFQRKSKFNIVGDVLSVTEKEKNSTTQTSTSTIASVGTEDYVDDNYEASQGAGVETTILPQVATTTTSTTSTTRRTRGRGRTQYKKVSESEPKYSASYWRRRGRGRSSTTTVVPKEELKMKETTLKEESRVVEISEKNIEETTTKPVKEETLETTSMKEDIEETTLRPVKEDTLETTTNNEETLDLKEETQIDSESPSLEDLETTTVSEEATREDKFQVVSETSAVDAKEEALLTQNETKDLSQETTTISETSTVTEDTKEETKNLDETQIVSETSAVTEETKNLDDLQILSEDEKEDKLEARSGDFDDINLEENSNVTTPKVENVAQVSEDSVTEISVDTTTEEIFEDNIVEKTTEVVHETTETITEVTQVDLIEEKESEGIVLPKPKVSENEDEVLPKVEVSEEKKNETEEVLHKPETETTTEVLSTEFPKDYLHESEKTTFATTNMGPTETEPEFSPTSTSSSTTENHLIVTTSTNPSTSPDLDVSPESPNLTPAQATTESLSIPRGRSAHRRIRPSRPRSYRRPNPRHRFSTELFTSRPTRRKPPLEDEIDSNSLTSQLTTTELVATSPSEEVPPTDAPLFKSANPTQAESAKESLHTTPLSMTYKLSVRKGKLKSFIFNCFGKAINKFYSDPRDCRLFHYCTSGYTKNQLLDMKFVCDLGTYFDDEKLICTKEKPQRCL